MANANFIGVGPNPEGPDLPLGLGMELAQDPQAMQTFAGMTGAQKTALIAHLQGAGTGEEAKNRMASALRSLHSGKTQF